jgi:hypothetical protein
MMRFRGCGSAQLRAIAGSGMGRRFCGAALVVLALGYAVYTWQIYKTRGLFEYIGIDYRTYRSSAEIARASGFAQVYDLDVQARFQRPLHQAYSFGFWRTPFAPAPPPYPPAFILPLLWLPDFKPVRGFVFWTLLNAAALIVYLRRLMSATGAPSGRKVGYELLLSLPVFTTLVFGQIDVWLFIFTGEFLLAGMHRKEFRSGLWLGGLLLKPQSLILFVPGLLIGRRLKILAGWAVVAALVLSLSVALAGIEGMINLAELVRLYAANLPGTFPESMMNWRALTINHAFVLSPSLAWRVGMAGLMMTLTLLLASWLRPAPPGGPSFALLVLGTWAATAAVAWHSNVHMAMPMLAPLLYLALQQRLPRWLLQVWILAPGALFLEEAFRASVGHAHVVAGLAMLAVNSFVLGWVIWRLWSPTATASDLQPAR